MLPQEVVVGLESSVVPVGPVGTLESPHDLVPLFVRVVVTLQAGILLHPADRMLHGGRSSSRLRGLGPWNIPVGGSVVGAVSVRQRD